MYLFVAKIRYAHEVHFASWALVYQEYNWSFNFVSPFEKFYLRKGIRLAARASALISKKFKLKIETCGRERESCLDGHNPVRRTKTPRHTCNHFQHDCYYYSITVEVQWTMLKIGPILNKYADKGTSKDNSLILLPYIHHWFSQISQYLKI
jgi:hypothetical protein